MITTNHQRRTAGLSTLVVLALLTGATILGAAQPCELYCASKEHAFLDRCTAADNDPGLCAEAWRQASDSCIREQCTLEVRVPEEQALWVLAHRLIPELLGPGYRVVDVQPHYYDTTFGAPGSFVFSLEAEAGQYGYIEIGASAEMPPVVCYGTDQPAAEALVQTAIDKLTEAFGEGDYQLDRRYLSAAHPVLEFVSAGQPFYFSVFFDDVSRSFELEDDPEADQDALAIRREANRRQWRFYLDTYLD